VVTDGSVKKILTTVIAGRRRIEERTKDPVQDASDDESQRIEEGAIETRPSADRASAATRNEPVTDYSASPFLSISHFFPRRASRFFKLSVMRGTNAFY
jgi:hypothetical protein